jgi:hypothetical protein
VPSAVPTRAAVFEPLITVAKARVVSLVENGVLAAEDGEFLLRALIELESDGVGLFDGAAPADGEFYGAIGDYLVARVGAVAVDAGVLAPGTAETLAGLASTEGDRVSQLLLIPRTGACGPALDRAVLRLISHEGGRA